MIQSRRCESFTAKALARDRIGGEAGWQNLYGYAPIQIGIVCKVNLAHSSGRDVLDDSIAS
jgi:hypothetical protein